MNDLNEQDYILIIRQKRTGRVFSLNFDLNNDKKQLIKGIDMLLKNIGLNKSDEEITKIDMDIQLLLEKKRVLTGVRDCPTCKKE